MFDDENGDLRIRNGNNNKKQSSNTNNEYSINIMVDNSNSKANRAVA
jgi:hypothetical protein